VVNGRAGKMRVTFKMFAGLLSTWQSRCEQAAEFASGLTPDRLINISCSATVVIVWYWAETTAVQPA
jgi:hypothetical protein